jgi:hypothetical protein
VRRRPRTQPRVPGGRLPAGSALLPELERELRREAARFGVSRSFVIATALAWVLDVEAQPDYRRTRTPLRLVHRKGA